MIDRVTDAVGRLGPVGDSHAMARNILDVWQWTVTPWRTPRTEALRFSWDHAWSGCSASVYPTAFARRHANVVAAPAPPQLPLDGSTRIHLIPKTV